MGSQITSDNNMDIFNRYRFTSNFPYKIKDLDFPRRTNPSGGTSNSARVSFRTKRAQLVKKKS